MASSPCTDLWNKTWAQEQALAAGKQESKSTLRARARKVGACPDTGRVSFAMAQALLWGRVAEGRGLGGLSAFRRAEGWAAKAYERDPEFLEGMPRRVLGSMWAMGGQYLSGRDSESGLELLTEQVERYPRGDENVLRAVQALVSLGDPEAAHEVYCAYSKLPNAWAKLTKESQGLKIELETAFRDEELQCLDKGEMS